MNEEDFIHAAILRTGAFREFTLHALINTGNNRVFRMETPAGSFVIKHYFQHPGDSRDRFLNERAFYSFVENSGIHRTPKPLHWLPSERLAVFEFVDGEKPLAVDSRELHEALSFFKELNRHRLSSEGAALPKASEACFSVREHLDCVKRRVLKLQQIGNAEEIDRQAAEFVGDKITPAWKKLDEIAENLPSAGIDAELPADARCVSPSDFGFHNSIRGPDGGLRFFDFEYAGWDDPAKTVCDFFCQPRVPVARSWMGAFIAGFLEYFPRTGLEERVKLLMPLYQIKWCCIMMNEFLPVENQRRTFSNPDDPSFQRKARQLAKAKDFFNTLNHEP